LIDKTKKDKKVKGKRTPFGVRFPHLGGDEREGTSRSKSGVGVPTPDRLERRAGKEDPSAIYTITQNCDEK
jgi:hypothetical protein